MPIRANVAPMRRLRRLLAVTAVVAAGGCSPLVASLDLGGDVPEGFVGAISGGETRRAWDLICPALRFGMPFETFRGAVEANPFLLSATGVTINEYRSGGGLAVVQRGWLESTSGVTAAGFYLSKVGGTWCLTGVEVGGTPALPAPGARAGGAAAAAGAPAGDRAQLAPALRNDAYRAYGLANPATRRYRMTSGGAAPVVGTQRADLLETAPTSARFRIVRGGGLAVLGSLEVALEADGIHLVASSQGAVQERTLILPAKLERGTTWPSGYEIGSDAAGTRYRATDVVEGRESLATPAGTFDAIRILSNATVESGATHATVRTVVWYALDVGSVRTESETSVDGETTRVVVELLDDGEGS